MNGYSLSQLRHEVWSGQLPILFELYEHDVAATTMPQPQLVMAHRCSYIPLVFLSSYAWSTLQSYSVTRPNEGPKFWFEDAISQTPLRWHLPLGFIYDGISQLPPKATSSSKLDSENDESTGQSKGLTSEKSPAPWTDVNLSVADENDRKHTYFTYPSERYTQRLPWRIIVHLSDPPSNTVLPCEGEDTVRWQYYQTLKQAIFLQQRTVQPIMEMPEAAQQRLWTCLTKTDFEGTLAAAPLLEPSSSTQLSPIHTMYESFEELFAEEPTEIDRDSETQAEQLKRRREAAHAVASLTIPVRLVVSSLNGPVHQARIVSESSMTLSSALTSAFSSVLSVIKEDSLKNSKDAIRWFIHGIYITESAPLSEVYRAFRYPDGYLYVIAMNTNVDDKS